MTILPESGDFLKENARVAIYPSKTYAMRREAGTVVGMTDGLDAIEQAVYKALMTERSAYLAYSDNYGVELNDLIGMPTSYVLPELKRRITEALCWDTRIDSVDGFAFDVEKGRVHARFTVHSTEGDRMGEIEVAV